MLTPTGPGQSPALLPSPKRRWLGLAALIIFILSFTLAPIRTAGL